MCIQAFTLIDAQDLRLQGKWSTLLAQICAQIKHNTKDYLQCVCN